MINIYITATNTNIGKTYTSLKLIKAFTSLGYRVGVMKPIETGVVDKPEDATLLLKEAKKSNPDFAHITLEDVCPIQFILPAAPYVAKGEEKIDFEKIKKAHKKLLKYCDVLLIESAGGVMTPIEDDIIMMDFARAFKTSTLLITDDQLGCINNTLLNMQLFKNYREKFIWCVNKKSQDNSFETVSLPYFEAKFDKVLTVQNDIEEIVKNLLSLSQE